MGNCKHFTGIQNKVCEAGVTYADFLPNYALPCLQLGCDKRPEGICTKREYPTQEECEKRERDMIESVERIGVARAAIIAHTGAGKGKGAQGSIPCPCCGGTLRYSVASYNGHVHAACSNTECVRWME